MLRGWGVTAVGLLAALLVAAGAGSTLRGLDAHAPAAATVPDAPVLDSAAPGDGAVTLAWSAPASGGPLDSYQVYRGVLPDSLAPLTTAGGAATGFTDATPANLTTYYYAVAAVNGDGEGPQSNVLSATPMAPTAPSAPYLNVTPHDGSVAIDWDNGLHGSSPITEYRLYRGLVSGPDKTLLQTFGPSVFDYTDTAVSNGTTYYYELIAANAVGESPPSAERAALPAAAPGAPVLDSAVPGNAQVSLAWTAPVSNGGAEITGYKLYRVTTSGDGTLLTTVGAVTGYTDATAVNGTTYFYEVAAVNAAGEGQRSNERSATPVTVPDAPVLDSATPGDSSVTLAWTPPAADGGSALTGYRVYRGTTSGAKTLLDTLGVVAGYADETAVNGTTYFYAVSAVTNVGEGPFSSDRSATPRTVPDAPALVSATPASSSVALVWTPPSDGGAAISGYRVYRATGAGSATLLETIGVVTTYTDTTAVNGTAYRYSVAALNAAGEGARSTELTATPRTIPGAPTLDAAISGNAQVTLAWTPPASNGGAAISAYKLYRGTTSGGKTLVKTLGDVTGYTDTGLTNGTTYFYELSAVNVAGEGARSNELSSKPATVPNPPTLILAVPSNGQVQLTWSAPSVNGGSPVTGYKVYRRGASGEVAPVTTTGLTLTISGLQNGTTYDFTVSAVNAVGESTRSNELSATPVSVPGAPSLTSATPADSSVALVWSPPASNNGREITAYSVYRGPTGGAVALLATVGVVTSYTDTTAVNGTTYRYRVSATNSIGEGPSSNERTATPGTVAGAPALNSATAGIGSVALAWSAPASNGGVPITGYRVYRGTATGTGTLLANLGVVTGYTDSTATGGTTWFYRVTAVNFFGESAASNERSARPPSAPDAPTLDTAGPAGNAILLAWSPPASNGGSAITGYKVYRGPSTGSGTLLATLGAVTTYTDATAEPGETYYYKVSAVNALGESPRSNERATTVPGKPGAPVLAPALAGNGSVALNWSAPASNGGSAITGYKVYRAGPTAGETLLATVGVGRDYGDNTVSNGSIYTYRVSAVNAIGEGPKSTASTALPAPVSVGRPWWWSGPCDAPSWNAKAAALGWTGAGAHELGASFLGVQACGPTPGSAAPTVAWSRPGVAVPAWDASELAFRFMAQLYGVRPYGGAPRDVVRSYTPALGGGLQRIENGTTGVAPVPGDVIAFDNQAGGSGHVAIVVASSVDFAGSGTITIMSQNDTDTGWRSLAVGSWVVRSFGLNIPSGWLHDPAARASGSVAPSGREGARPPLESGPRADVPAFTPPGDGTRTPPPHMGAG